MSFIHLFIHIQHIVRKICPLLVYFRCVCWGAHACASLRVGLIKILALGPVITSSCHCVCVRVGMCSKPCVCVRACVYICASRHHGGCHMGAITPLARKQSARLTWVGHRSRHHNTHTQTRTHRISCMCTIKVVAH